MSSNFNFTVTFFSLECLLKTLFQHTVQCVCVWGGGTSGTKGFESPPQVPTVLNNIFMLLLGFFLYRDCKIRYGRLNEVDCVILQNSTEK